jgi:hypothetical protein
LKVKTKNIKQLHDYFVDVDELFIEYTKYQLEYKIVRTEYEKNILNNTNKDLITKIDTILIENKNQSQQIADLLSRTNDIYNQNIETHDKLNVLTNKTKKVVKEFEKVTPNIVSKIENKQLQEHFIVMHDSIEFDTYYIIRTQTRNVNNAIKNLRKKKSKSIYKLYETIDYQHPKNLYILLKNYINQHNLMNKIIFNNTTITVFDEYKCSSTNNTKHKLIKIINYILDNITANIKSNIDQVKDII